MIFLTGFPGFLGTRLVRLLAEKHPHAEFRLLVQTKFMRTAERTLQAHGLTDRADLVPADITRPDLMLSEPRRAEMTAGVTRAFHLAAVYDLTIGRDVAWRVNVSGTRHVLDFLEDCPKLEHFGYVSTAYVSGKRTGRILEGELWHAAGFKNFYEETKYEAEVLVQERMDRIPTTIFRPGIVVGDSRTGATDKFDGPYFILKVLRYLPSYTLMTRLGAGDKPVNLVPVDYVTKAMAYLAEPEHAGKVFHLTDPNALTTQEIMELFMKELGMEALFVPVPVPAARLLMQTPAGSLLGLSPQFVDYFDFPAYYDSRNAQEALAGSGIRCPHLKTYAPRMVSYMRLHEGTRSAAMY